MVARSYSRQMLQTAREIRSTGHVRPSIYKYQYNIPPEIFQEIAKSVGKNGTCSSTPLLRLISCLGLADWFASMAKCFENISRFICEGFPPCTMASCFGSELALHLIVVHLFRSPTSMPKTLIHPCDSHLENLYLLLLGEVRKYRQHHYDRV
jgi:hypothetical protein